KKSVCRFRFDIAHELGHLVLHDGITTGDMITESQANRFASAFLMPRVSFSKEFPALRGRQFDWSKLVEFKSRWKVSLKAIIYRASSLGLITPEKARSGFLFLNTKGYTKE
ncbi:MAG: ImmA/IrrE family metallo-endopeptidase, partial [Aeromonas sp.]